MKIAFIGCLDFSYVTLAHVMSQPDAEIVGVVTRRASSFNADFRSLEDLAVAAEVPVYFCDDGDQTGVATFLREVAPVVT